MQHLRSYEREQIRWQRAEIFKKRQGAVAMSSPEISARLLCRSAYWPKDRSRGLVQEFRPFQHLSNERMFDEKNGFVYVLFIIGGNPLEIERRFLWAATSQLYCNNKDFSHWYRKLQHIIIEAVEHYQKMFVPPKDFNIVR